MKLLLDTHAFLWFLAGDRRLPASTQRRIEHDGSDRFLSIASVWEMAIKVSLGKLVLEDPLRDIVDAGTGENGIALLGVTRDHALRVATLPWHHRDPFDRMLAAQALSDGLTLVGNDAAFDAYGITRAW